MSALHDWFLWAYHPDNLEVSLFQVDEELKKYQRIDIMTFP